jgi:ABC-2 type transport system ATP-binding protein
VLLTTQYLEEADRLADRLAVIDHGKVIAEGTPAQLKAKLGATAIELGFGERQEQAERATRILAGLPDVAPERSAGTVRLTSSDGSRILVEVLRALDADEVVPSTVAVREPSLDDVFLALTGHRAESEQRDAAAHRGGQS